MRKTILVTGGAGYIGSHICRALAGAGYVSVAFDNLSTGHEGAVKWGPLEIGDIRDSGRLAAVMESYRPVAVVHSAALIDSEASFSKADTYFDVNVEGTRRLLESMHRFNVDRLVFSSSAAVYGKASSVPIPESCPAAPITPYGETKASVESILAGEAQDCGIRSISLRYFNAAGADADTGIGETRKQATHLIPRVLRVATDEAVEIVINGDDYPTPDGTCIRDYVHVRDLADAHLRAIERLDTGPPARAINLGSGGGESILAVVETARRITGAEIPVRFGPRRDGDPAALVADIRFAQEELGWRPRYSNLERVIGDAHRWATQRDVAQG